MPTGTRARDSGPNVDAVEAQGGRSTFDGNHTDDLMSWLIIRGGKKELDPRDLNELMLRTARGHLSWCVFLI